MSLQYLEQKLNHYSTLSKNETKLESPKNPIHILKEKHKRQKKDFRIIIGGDNGNGKSSLAAREGEIENPNTFIKRPQWAVDHQIHFFAKSWLGALPLMKKYSVNVYDEPAQSGGHHREFMSEANIIITKTVATARYLRLDIPINIPFIDMLDIDVRKLCQVYVYCYDQGHAEVFLISNPKFGGDPWYEKIIDEFTWDMPNQDLWKLYEAKKFKTEDKVYERYTQKLERKDKDDRGDDELLKIIEDNYDFLIGNSHSLSVTKMTAALDCGRDRARRIKGKWEMQNLDKQEKEE